MTKYLNEGDNIHNPRINAARSSMVIVVWVLNKAVKTTPEKLPYYCKFCCCKLLYC